MTRDAFYSVCVLQDGSWRYSRTFERLQAAKKWAKWLNTLAYITEVAIYKGGPGGERIA